MKRRIIGIPLACVALVAGGAFSAYAEKVPLAQVPEAVQKAIKQQAAGENLQHVERETRDGKVIYEAEFKREGLNRRVHFASDGSMLPATDLSTRFERTPSVAYGELPAPVQRAIREQQAGRIIADIDRETWNGKTVYEVEFKEQGPNSRVHIAQDGSLVVDKAMKRGTYMGVQLRDTPATVQSTVKRIAGDAEIADVDREMKNGQVVWDVELRQEGLNRHLLIADSGALLDDSEARGTAPGLRERVRGTTERIRDKVDLDLDRGTVMSLDQLPVAVQNTIKKYGNVSNLKPIKRELDDGKAQYDVEFEKDGKNTRLTIDGNGTVLKDNPIFFICISTIGSADEILAFSTIRTSKNPTDSISRRKSWEN